MLQNLTGWHALVILAIILLVFGSAKLPALARSVGQSVRILKDETHDAGPTTTARQPDAQAVAVEPLADRRAS
ncbi:MAG: Sec-independent protein translocase subunit TatA/TatB [Nocardioides sp.]|uniref:Sec-independent protein translocase subunit TatA/TatB n=1 Tax=Nocardioides sp. TaxID=35761 RepID=UPI003D6A3A91